MEKNYAGFKYSAWEQVINRYINQAKKQPLHCIDGIAITRNEIKAARELNDTKAEKLYITLLCVAKLKNLRNALNNNWVSEADTELFKLANISSRNILERGYIFNALYSKGYVSFAARVDNLNTRVEKIYDDECELYITDLRNIGNQYLKHLGGKYVECSECGLVVKQSRNGRVKYCSECAKKMDRKKSIQRYKDKL